MEGNLQSLAADGSGRVVYGGLLDLGGVGKEPGYMELDQLLAPLGSPHPLPWPVTSILHYQLEITTGADGTTVAAGGDDSGQGRYISQLDANGNELWTSPWPVASQPDGAARPAGVAVLDDGTVGLVLTGQDLWLEAFDPSGQSLWAQTAPDAGPMDVLAGEDGFVVTSDLGVVAYAADGSQAWSVEADPRMRAQPCPDGTFVMAKSGGYVSFTPGGSPVEHELHLLDLLGYIPPADDPLAENNGIIEDALCTTDGVVIVLASISVYTPSQGDCATGG